MVNKAKEPSEEILKWLKQARRDLKTAKNNLKNKDYYASAFFSQQAVEKGLKALYIKRFKKLWRIHDLVELAKKVNAEAEIIEACIRINPAYTGTRYPDVFESYNEQNSGEIFKLAKKVLKWIEEQC
ncbi:MAG: HEPN domain-containing protein [Thermoplasmata archaeon]|nr:MAG: HEPN domain-containing protein [Thermoplasmata archaeon]